MEHIDLSNIPTLPGVYQFFDETKKIIYIGKAKNLKKRIASYFQKKEGLDNKVKVMLKRAHSLNYIIVDTEYDALLLENSLIKKWQPRYNILLKDDKTFPWICIKNEAFPRVFSTRHIIKDGSEYFGPFASVKTMYVLLDLIKKIYKLRTCKHNLAADNIKQKKYKVCLEYHINNCNGPCEAYETEEQYNETIKHIRHLVKGNISMVVQELKKMMQLYASHYEFEKAQIVKEKLDLLHNYQNKSTVVNSNINNVDVFSIKSLPHKAFVNYFKLINGAIVQSHNLEFNKKLDESDAEILTFAILDIRLRFNSTAKEVLIPLKIKSSIPGVKFSVPMIGDKKQLLELSQRNVNYFLLDCVKKEHEKNPKLKEERLLIQLKDDLKIKKHPKHIECFDISNMQGTHSVGALVVFKNSKPAKKEYRIFNIKTVEGPNDFASLEEVIFRRYKRVLDETQTMPQLIIIDGGKGQLSAAVKSLQKLNLMDKVSVIGIAKKLEEIFFPFDSIPLYLDKRSESLRLIQRIRDEAHRFGIKHYRKKAEKGTINSELQQIKGIGTETINKLLSAYKSVAEIKKQSKEELEKIIQPSKAEKLITYFKNNSI